MGKVLILPLESYIYLLNLVWGINEKRNNRVIRTFTIHHPNGIEIEQDDFRLSLDEIKEKLANKNLPYEESKAEIIRVNI